MRIAIIGASGNSGRALSRLALDAGHEVTGFVRDASKVSDLAGAQFAVEESGLADEELLGKQLAGHDAVVNAAGYVSDHHFTPLVERVIGASQRALGPGGRLWIYGGAALLDVPGTTTMTADLPRVPPVYQAHRINRQRLLETTLDWSIACPGPMIPSPDGRPTPGLGISTESWAIPTPQLLPRLPRILQALAFKRSTPHITVYYEDMARVIIANLERGGPLARKRVGLALPPGMTRSKSDAFARVLA